MNVLMTADTMGGVWTYACELANELARRDVAVVVAALGRAPDDEQRSALDGPILAARDCRLEWMPDPWDDVAASGEWLLELAEEFEPDVVHVNGYVHAALDWDAPVLVAAHSDVLTWFEAVRGVPAPAAWNRYRNEVERGLRAADAVVAPTAAMLDALRRHYEFHADPIVIPNGRAVSAPASRVAKEPLVLGAGRAWDEAKNLEALERVAPTLGWRVLVLGDGTRRGRVSGAAVADSMRRASIFALPARYEPFGLSALEAAASGCALVLGDIESLREVWADAAVYVDPTDDRDLRRTLRRLIADDRARTSYAGASTARARRFTPGRMADAYLDLYERLQTLEPAELERA